MKPTISTDHSVKIYSLIIACSTRMNTIIIILIYIFFSFHFLVLFYCKSFRLSFHDSNEQRGFEIIKGKFSVRLELVSLFVWLNTPAALPTELQRAIGFQKPKPYL